MTTVNCLCNDDEESSDSVTCDNSCSTISVNNVNDFVQQLLCYKCKVVDLVKEQMKNCECEQSNLLSQICNDDTKLPSPNEKEEPKTLTKREAKEEPEVETRENETENKNQLSSSSPNSYWKKILYGILLTLLLIIAIWLIYTRMLGTRVCTKSGLCLPIPFVACPPRPRVF